MKALLLRIPPAEIVRLLRAEIAMEHGQPELYVRGHTDFLIEEDFDRRAYGLTDGNGYDLVTEEAELCIEPRVERDYWVLSLVYRKEIGPQRVADEDRFFGGELTFEDFAERFLAADGGAVKVRLDLQTPLAERHFIRWWADLRARHPNDQREPTGRLIAAGRQ